jgi:ERO1-like protein alpha
MCALPDCSVCECPADEVPVPWRALRPGLDVEAPQGGPLTPQTAECVGDQSAEGLQEAQLNAVEGLVNTGDGPGAPSKDTQAAWVQRDNPWTADDEAVGETDRQAVYVNLRLNPERYTGYTGEHAHRVWTAIYAQPCFAGQGGGLCAARQAAPLEEAGVFYRLISGMHASISTHIAADFLLQRGGGGSDDVWGPNYGVFWDRVGSHPDRLENLRFITAFVMQAVNKAKPLLLAADYSTGFPDQDRATHDHLRQLLTRPALLSGCALAPFNELRLFAGPDGPRLKARARMQATAGRVTDSQCSTFCHAGGDAGLFPQHQRRHGLRRVREVPPVGQAPDAGPGHRAKGVFSDPGMSRRVVLTG